MKSAGMTSLLTSMALGLWLAGCAPGPEPGDSGQDPLPEGAIEVEEGLYMIPLAAPVEGCQAYRAHAPGQMVAQVIYYRAKDGGFVTDRREAHCP